MGPKMAKFGKKNYSTKIALVYLCLCQIFSQIGEPNFWTKFWPEWPKWAQNGQIRQKKLFHQNRTSLLVFMSNFQPNRRK